MFRRHCVYMILLWVLFASTLLAQEQPIPRRTIEERAMKQTEMLVRELDITDSLVRDTLYRIHLRYARSRDEVSNRSEAVERINKLLSELKGVLTVKQFERLQSIPRQQGARVHRVERDSLDQEPTLHKP